MSRPEFEIKFTSREMEEFVGLPTFATQHSAGMDLKSPESFVLGPGEQRLVKAGFAIWIKDPDYAAIIAPRSGLGLKGLVVGNTIGLIDADYQGEIGICVWNRTDSETFHVQAGDRIAQMFFVQVNQPRFTIVDEFTSETDRGVGGFGSTGVSNA